MITPAQRKQIKAVLNNQPTNPPSPHLTPAEKQELRTLIDAGHEDDAWAELHYKSQAAIGNAMEAVMRKTRKDYAAPAAKVNDASVAAKAAIPGKMPRVSIGKLAVTAAWNIENKTGKKATAKQVISHLQLKIEVETILIKKINNGVTWQTTKCKNVNYDISSCSKTLEIWNKSRS